MTPLDIAVEALEEIAGSDYAFEGHGCLHCEMAAEALASIKRQLVLTPKQGTIYEFNKAD